MSPATPPLLHLYRIGLAAFEPAAAGLLLWRERKGKEDPARLRERRGWPSLDRPEGHLAWLHGASVGETLSLMPVVEQLVHRGPRGPRHLRHAHLRRRHRPPPAARRHRTSSCPSTCRATCAASSITGSPTSCCSPNPRSGRTSSSSSSDRGIPLILVNGRHVGALVPALGASCRRSARAIFARFALCLAQSAGDAERLARLGAPRVVGRRQPQVRRDAAARRIRARWRSSPASSPGGRCGSRRAPIRARRRVIAEVHRALAERLPQPPDDHRAAPSAARPETADIAWQAGAALRPALGRRAAGPRRPMSTSPTPSASSACSTASRRSSSWAARWCRAAARTRSSRPSSAAPSCTGRTCTTSPRSTRPSTGPAARSRSATARPSSAPSRSFCATRA